MEGRQACLTGRCWGERTGIMNTTLATASSYKDRRTALLVAGVLEIILGAAAWLMAALMLLGASLAASQGGARVATMIPGMAVYGVGGVVFVVLGIGSIRARRWARALWLVVATSWLMIGILTLGMMLLMLPAMLQGPGGGVPAPPPGVQTLILAMVLAFMGVLGVALPAGLILFYRSPHVQATCEAENPRASWTDRSPLPVLGAAMWLGSMAVALPWMGLVYGGLYPAFGGFARGAFGHSLWVVSGLLSGLAAFGVFRQSKPLWWLAFGLVIALGASASLTYLVADLRQLYEAMGMGGVQLEQIERMGMLRPSYMVATTLTAILPLLTLLVWARTCFYPAPPLDSAPATPGEGA